MPKVTPLFVPFPWVLDPIPLPPPLRECAFTTTHPKLTPPTPLFPGASSFHRIKHILSHWGQTTVFCYICALGLWEALLSLVFGSISRSSEESRLVDIHYGVAIPLGSFSPFPNSSTWFPNLIQWWSVSICIWLKSVSCRDSQRTAMPGSCLQAQYGISYRFWVWSAGMGWIKGGLVTGWPFLQSLLHFCPCISFRQEQF